MWKEKYEMEIGQKTHSFGVSKVTDSTASN
jgi:hypothetical protein